MSTHKLSITGIDCANCAANLERHIAKIDGLSNVSINFMGEKLIFDCDDAKYDEMIGKIKAVIDKVEPDAVLGNGQKPRQTKEHHHEHGEECGCGHDHHHDHGEECGCGHDHHHEHGEECSCGHEHHHDHGEECGCGHEHHHEHGEECGCGHDHHHDHGEECGCGHDHHHEHGEECGCGHEHHHDEPDENAKFVKCKTELTDVDCPNCAEKLKNAISEIDGIYNVSVNHIRERLIFVCESEKAEKLIDEIKKVAKDALPEANVGEILSKEETERPEIHHHEHGEECGCGHDHHHEHGEECGCGHDHHREHGEECGRGHDHHHEHGEECGCGHDHHHDHGKECGCGHDHHHDHGKECGCGHDHHHEHKEISDRSHKMSITGIDCANCAGNLERHIAKIEGLSNVSINFMQEKLMFDCDPDKFPALLEEIKKCIDKYEPDAVLGEDEKSHGHEHHHDHGEECSCGHDHHHEHKEISGRSHKMSITGIDCANCAGNLERHIAKIDGLENVSINFMQEKLMFDCDPDKFPALLEEIKKCIDKYEPDAVLGEDEKSHSHDHHEDKEISGRSHKMSITGIDCANCAGNLERHIAKIEGLSNVSINFMQEKLMFDCDPDKFPALLEEIKKCIDKYEPDAVLGEDEVEHEHHHHDGEGAIDESAKHHTGSCKYIIKGLDCANCAAALERRISEQVDCISDVTLTFMNETLSFNVTEGSEDDAVKEIRRVIDDREPGVTIEKFTQEREKKIIKKPEHKKEKKMILFSAILLVLAIVLKNIMPEGTTNFIVSGIVFMISYFIVGAPVLKSALRNLKKGQWMDEQFLMAIATVGAIGTGEFQEGVFVMLLYQIGELFQAIAVENSRQSISELMDIRADEANIKVNGNIKKVPVEDVYVDDIIVIRPGEKVPLDGIVLSGSSSLNTSALTGESLPRDVQVGDEVISGCVNVQGLLEVRVTKPASESTVAKILDLMENSSNRKRNTENFISAFARYYTPTVVYLALFVSFVVPGIMALLGNGSYLSLLPDFFHRGLMFLVVSCPCAIVISVPLTYFSGIGGLSKKGVLVKGSNYLDALTMVDTVVFDKTGTITKGQFSITKIDSKIDEKELIKLAAYAEYNSTHPISAAIVTSYGKENINPVLISKVDEIAGHGVKAVIDDKEVLAGNAKLMATNGIEIPEVDTIGTVVYIAVDKAYAGYITVADTIKPTSKRAMAALKANGIRNTVMLTGDNKKVADAIAEDCGITEVHSDLLPQDKVSEFDKISKTGNCAYVGDGINDAPVLAMANVGFAMGGLGSDAAIEAADIVIMNDDLTLIAEAVKGAKKTRGIVKFNIVFSIAVKVLILTLAGFGITDNMMIAIFGDVGVMLLAVLNAIRALN